MASLFLSYAVVILLFIKFAQQHMPTYHVYGYLGHLFKYDLITKYDGMCEVSVIKVRYYMYLCFVLFFYIENVHVTITGIRVPMPPQYYFYLLFSFRALFQMHSGLTLSLENLE